MATRLTPEKLKELQLLRHEDYLKNMERERIKKALEKYRNDVIKENDKNEAVMVSALEISQQKSTNPQNEVVVSRLANLEKVLRQ